MDLQESRHPNRRQIRLIGDQDKLEKSSQEEKMLRKMLIVGDRPILGGEILSYDGPTFEIHGHRAALIGGRAYCQGCNSVGIIAKSGGPLRLKFISEVALEYDVVCCDCPQPQSLLSSLKGASIYDDGLDPLASIDLASLPLSSGLNPPEVAAMKKVVDDRVSHPTEADQTERICHNMTNKEFGVMVMKLRDAAIDYIVKKRLPELARWDSDAQSRVRTWFGVSDQNTREYLQSGLLACARVLRGIEEKNFVRFTENGKLLTCVMGSALGTAAAVCKPDTATHTIAIGVDFCNFRYDSMENFNTKLTIDGDSRLLTLLHEVTHFNDTFSSEDIWYGTRYARSKATSNEKMAKINADSIAAYILGVTDE
jgi:hypothetical protein